ncbi:3-deoxy-D-manno-octulosonic acid transferase [Nitrospira lenta]|uniref:3-deoxy-D-manno-octulosonic acid transferase n=1 Tax=Nitrospira lenta TaxID=1436998 RepID=A0A330LF61_9BACT|nr:3-deoxy-D-manno-octulosonic acid transferase [Nitrospira lenta]SPP65648.1 3-deoxy-D-manno-octulosonic-acid transferase [Nitrospira lenta]
MWRLLYNTLLILATPIVLCILLAKKRCRRGLLDRFGLRVRPVLEPSGERRPLIWIHAVSLGEVVAVTPLVKELHRHHPDHKLIVSTVTETGREAVEQRLAGIAEHRYAPLDVPWAVSCVIAQWQPVLYAFVETELWPNLLWTLRDRQVPTVMVNGRLSSRSFARQHIAGLISFYRSVLRSLTLCLMQSERDVQRIVALGADPSRVHRTGNIKFDQPMPSMAAVSSLRTELGLQEGESLLLAGSTHAGEEEMLVAAYRQVIAAHPHAVLMLAPRHTERAADVVALIQAAGLPVQRKSELDSGGAGPRVIILDTRGELARAYHEATVAFVGGTLVPVGGHNLLEPAVWSKPVLFGPYTDHCAEIATLLLESGGAVRVSGAEDLARTVCAWLEDSAARRQVGEAARRTVADNQGALRRSMELIESCLPKDPSPSFRSVGSAPQPMTARP